MATKKSQTQPKKKPGSVTAPFQVAAVWPHHESPLLLSMVGGRQVFLATSFTPVNFESIEELRYDRWPSEYASEEITKNIPRWLILIPYETYNIEKFARQPSDHPLAWEIHGGLIWDNLEEDATYVSLRSAQESRFHMTSNRIKDVLNDARNFSLSKPRPIPLAPETSDETYLDTVQKILRNISDGDFYQINLLRYFRSLAGSDWGNLCSLMQQNSGPHGILLAMGNRIIASFSPERFIEITPDKEHASINTWPIKGTAPRNMNNEKLDEANGKKLASSTKDLAELHMIIDLMRNDFAKICQPGTVSVLNKGELKNFFHVWHLEGQVSGLLNTGLNLKSILSAICPGGSITGAPKVAAMRRIEQEEGRQRGFFMGNFLRINHDGSLQSNIMIRTLTSDNWMRSFSYAAGSGIVIKSDPKTELREIDAKCAPVTLMKQEKDKINGTNETEDEIW